MTTCEQSLICQNESKLDILPLRTQLRDIHVHRPLVAAIARKIVDRLTRRSQQIATFPRSGRVVREANELNIREVLEGSYRIIYHLLDDEVEIIAVVRSARPWPEKP